MTDSQNSGAATTPSSLWAQAGQPDPHGTRYECERAELALGQMTDDALANAVFLHGNERPTLDQINAGALPAIVYLTAAQDRIRWLSRALEATQTQLNELSGNSGGLDRAALSESVDRLAEHMRDHGNDDFWDSTAVEMVNGLKRMIGNPVELRRESCKQPLHVGVDLANGPDATVFFNAGQRPQAVKR